MMNHWAATAPLVCLLDQMTLGDVARRMNSGACGIVARKDLSVSVTYWLIIQNGVEEIVG